MPFFFTFSAFYFWEPISISSCCIYFSEGFVQIVEGGTIALLSTVHFSF
jgi:hypothetical protein